MYSVGENFYYEIDDEEYEYYVIGDMIIKGKEYLVAEDEDHNKKVFIYDDIVEEILMVEGEEEQDELLEMWENEFYGTSEEIGIWADDEFNSDYDDEEEEVDNEDYVEIDGLTEFDDEDDMYF
jgi:DNA-directed RNA polymerase subunit delta